MDSLAVRGDDDTSSIEPRPRVAGRRARAGFSTRWSALCRAGLVGITCAALGVSTAFAQVPGDSLVLEGNYIRTGVSNNGTLGVGGNTSPGFIFDSTGSGTFNTANDYLTPGTPFEGFSISYAGASVLENNNTGNTIEIGTAAAPTTVDSATSGFDHAVSWTGTIAGVLTIEHLYGLDDDAKQVNIKTTITALTNLSDLKFARWIDPDSGGTSSENSRGNSTLGLAPEDWVNSVSESNGATLGLFSASSVTHNTAITSPWSTDPDDYLAGSADSVGDDAIGIGFDIGTLSNGNSVVLEYNYAVAADPNDFDFDLGKWTGATDSDFDDATNWDPQEVATNGAIVRVESGGTSTLNHNVTGNTYSGWQFNAGGAQVTVQGNDVTLSDGASLTNNSSHEQSFDVAVIGAGDLNISAQGGGLQFENIQIADGSTLTFDTADSISGTVNGVISGTGSSLVKTGDGTLTLSGANTYSGGTTVSGGKLVGDSTSLSGNVTNNAEVEFNQATGGTYAGVMSGTGSLTKTGAGTLTLSGANTSTGGTTISTGTLQLDGGNNRLATTGNVSVSSGATFDLNGNDQQVAALNAAGNVTLGTGALTVASGTVSGVVSGTGSVTKTGAGTLTLSGANTYTGGTSLQQGTVVLNSDAALGTGTVNIVGNVTLSTTTGVTSANDWTTASGNVITFDVGDVRTGDDFVINGEFSGASSLVKNGAGVVNITSATNFTATSTTINAGQLIVSSGQSHDVVNDSTLELSESTGGEFSGDITGTGNLIKTGSGTATLSGENTYSGGTTVQSGTLIGSAGNSGAGRTGSLPGAGSSSTEIITVNNGATIVFDQQSGEDGQFTGSIGGDGGVQKTGTGSLTFNGDIDASTGGLTIEDGQLNMQGGSVDGWTHINSGGTLGGTGNFTGGLHVHSGGVHAPGNSIGTDLTNNYVHDPGSTLEIEIDENGNSDLVQDSGTVTINGGTVLVKPDAGVDPNDFRIGTEYTFITSTNPIQGVGFDDVMMSGFDFPLVVLFRESNSYGFRLLGFQFISETPNQSALGTWLDNSAIDGTASNELIDVMSAIGGLNSFAEMRSAMDQLYGDIYPTLAIANVQLTNRYYDRLSRHARHTGQAPVVTTAHGSLLALNRPVQSQWTGAVYGHGLGGEAYTDGNARGFNLSTGGSMAMLERHIDDRATVGLVFDYASSYVALQNSSDHSEFDNFRWGTYLVRGVDGGYWIAAATLGYDDYETTRVIDFGTGGNRVFRTAESDHDGWQGSTYLERGWNVELLEDTLFQPFVALQYIHYELGDVNESGAGALNLASDGMGFDSLRTRVGGNLELLTGPRGTVSFAAAWTHELLDQTTGLIDTRLAGATGDTTFAVQGVDLGRDWVLFGPRARMPLSSNVELFGAYDLYLNDHQALHAGSGGLLVAW